MLSLQAGNKMNLDLKNLALFLRVAELGKIGRAGEEFELSSTNASQRIQQLENQVGVKLFHRTTRTVTLTYDGEVFREHAKRILDDVEEVSNVFKTDKNKVKGKIKISVSSSYGRIYIVPFIPELLKRYPDLEIDLDLSDKNIDLVEQGYDLAIRIGNLTSNSLLARKLADNPTLLVASPDYVKQHGMPKAPEELKQHICLPFANLNNWTFKDTHGELIDVTVKGPLTINLGDAIGDLVEAGMGIGMASYWHAAPAIKAGKLVQILPDFPIWPETKIWAVRPAGRIMPTRVKAFLDFIEKVIFETNQKRYGSLIK